MRCKHLERCFLDEEQTNRLTEEEEKMKIEI